jgi:hypothetical protein
MPIRLLSTVLLLSLFMMGCEGARTSVTPSEPPSIESLNEHPLIGELGVPVGTVVEIRATVIDGHDLGTKAADGKYLLKVTEVGGRPLTPSPYMYFRVPGFVHVNVASDRFALYKLKNRGNASQLDETQMAELEKRYAGKQVRLVVYEVGEYSGLPRNIRDIPREVGLWSGHNFSFSTSLVVLAERP